MGSRGVRAEGRVVPKSAQQKLLVRSVWTKVTRGGSDEEGSDSTPDSCSPASSQGSACHMHCYSSGRCQGGVGWADQHPSEDEGDPVSGGEEHVSRIAIDRDRGEETLHRLPCEMNRDPPRSHWRRWENLAHR